MSKRILVVDASRTIRILLSTYFTNAGHDVLCCPTAQEAVELLTQLGAAPIPDMIFLAIDRDKAAYKVLAYAKEHTAYTSLSFVVLVLKEEQAAIQQALKHLSFPVSYLVKPFHIQDAVALVSLPVPGPSSGHSRAREGCL